MPEFKPINTQEEFNAAIGERIARERAKFADYDDVKTSLEALQAEKAGFDKALNAAKTENDDLKKQIETANGKIKAYELKDLRTAAAVKHNLPLGLADRISGEDAASIEADAEALSQIFAGSRTQPLAATEPPAADAKDAALKSLLKNL